MPLTAYPQGQSSHGHQTSLDAKSVKWARLIMTHRIALLTAILAFLIAFPAGADEQPAEDQPVSYFKQIRPIFQTHCQGCHQPAKQSGEYVMTVFEKLITGGESGEAAIVPGKPAESSLLGQITPTDGEAEMPKGKDPLSVSEIELIGQWISEGAEDDTSPGGNESEGLRDLCQIDIKSRSPVADKALHDTVDASRIGYGGDRDQHRCNRDAVDRTAAGRFRPL